VPKQPGGEDDSAKLRFQEKRSRDQDGDFHQGREREDSVRPRFTGLTDWFVPADRRHDLVTQTIRDGHADPASKAEGAKRQRSAAPARAAIATIGRRE
jgi:hypothetical protein